jgi:acetolactate synthase-1/2/3 large subunit
MSKYSDDFMQWLKEAGYSHCFFVAGGNAMHLIESASYQFECEGEYLVLLLDKATN